VIEVDLGPSAGADGVPTAKDLLDALAELYPDLERRLRDERHVLRRHVNVFVGTTNIRELGDEAAPLADGAEVTILPAISGG
jgi:molybdopterin synthase sulfur carrier subunit